MNISILVHCVSSLETAVEEKKTHRKTRRKRVVAETLANLCNQPVVEILMQRNLISLSGEVGGGCSDFEIRSSTKLTGSFFRLRWKCKRKAPPFALL